MGRVMASFVIILTDMPAIHICAVHLLDISHP